MALEPREIGRRIAVARKRKGWTQLDFAYQSGVSPSAVQRWERGDLPRIKRLMEVAALLEIPVDALVEEHTGQVSAQQTVTDRYDRIEAQLAELRGMVAQLLREEEPRRADGVAQGPAR